jgi:GT2 family glycosyltransferase
MSNPEIAIIINSFNRFSLLKVCLEVLSKWLPTSNFKEKCVAIVYDAGSTDGSLGWLQSDGLKLNLPVELIIPKAGDDTSFASGLNSGVALAIQKYPSLKYLLFYETDNQILQPVPLSQAAQQLESNSKLGACGFTVRRHNGSWAGAGSPFPKISHFILGKPLTNKLGLESLPYKWEKSIIGDYEFSYADIVYTSPLLVKVKAWQESGGLDSQMFPFSDCDTDWAKRMRIKGWRMGVIKSNDVIHDNLQTLSTWSKSRAKQFHRGRLRYFLRHRPTAIRTVFPAILIIRHVLELATVKLFVKNQERRAQLTTQFTDLLKSCINKYE